MGNQLTDRKNDDRHLLPDGGIQGDRLNLAEAHALAQSRGYPAVMSSLNRDFAQGRLQPFGVDMVPSNDRQRGKGAKNYIDTWRTAAS